VGSVDRAVDVLPARDGRFGQRLAGRLGQLAELA
jgi:hypothetical protein